jgi:predicted metal-dependent phosphoesterase TrpH
MKRRLKADFHTHAAGDPHDPIAYSEEMLIEAAARQGIDVLAISCHDANVYCDNLARYARRRNLLLLPAQESIIEDKHVLMLNPDPEQAAATTFAELRRLGRRNAAFIAPHPFYPIQSALGRKLLRHIDLFDAIEYCTLYYPGVNFNLPALLTARRHGLPMVGTSDTHALPYGDSTFTWVTAEATVEGVVHAIREGHVEVVTRPRPVVDALHMLAFAVGKAFQEHRCCSISQEVSPP